MATNIAALPRTLASVTRDMISARHERDTLDRIGQARDLTDSEDQRFAFLDRRMLALRDEGRDILLAGTGLSWDAVQAVLS